MQKAKPLAAKGSRWKFPLKPFKTFPLRTHPKHKRDDEDDELDAPHAGVQVVGVRHCSTGIFFPRDETKKNFSAQLQVLRSRRTLFLVLAANFVSFPKNKWKTFPDEKTSPNELRNKCARWIRSSNCSKHQTDINKCSQ